MEECIFVFPIVMPRKYLGDETYDYDSIIKFIEEYGGKYEFFESKISDYQNAITMRDLTFDAVSDEMATKYLNRKIFLICFSHSSPYGLHYSAKYSDNVIGIICYPLRLYSQESFERRIWKFKTRQGWEKSMMNKYDVDEDFIDANDETLKKLRSNMGDVEGEVIYAIFDLNLQRNWTDIPTKFKVPTYLFSRLDMDVDSIIKLNFERKDIADMKAITSENDALLNSMMWNFDRVKLDKALIDENDSKLRIQHVIGGIDTSDRVMDALRIMMTDFFSTCKYKYHKYKLKYENTKDKIGGGGNKNVVIHISGPSGAGKTTLGEKLKKEYGDKIVVKDIDDIRREFINHEYGPEGRIIGKIDKDKYQKWIDDFVFGQNKPLVLVGLNNMPWWHEDLYYDMHADYKFYIELDLETIFKQKCGRFLDDVFIGNKSRLINDLLKDEENTMSGLTEALGVECGYKETKKLIDMWNRDYAKQDYKFMPREKIFDEVSQIIDSII